MIGIYKITSPTGKIYIGQSVNIERRIKKYKILDNCKEQPKLYNSLKKYGAKNHIYNIIEECNLDELNIRERHWQEYYEVIKKGLNCRLTKLDDRSGYFCKDSIEKMKANHGRFFKGKKLSKEHRENISKSLIGNKLSKDTKRKISQTRIRRKIKSPNGMLGKKHSEDTKKRIGKKSKGNVYGGKLVLDVTYGIFYDSIKECATTYNYKADTFLWRMRKGHHPNIIRL